MDVVSDSGASTQLQGPELPEGDVLSVVLQLPIKIFSLSLNQLRVTSSLHLKLHFPGRNELLGNSVTKLIFLGLIMIVCYFSLSSSPLMHNESLISLGDNNG